MLVGRLTHSPTHIPIIQHTHPRTQKRGRKKAEMLAHWIKWSSDFVAPNAIFSLLLFLECCTLLVFHSDITPLSSSLLLSHSLSRSPPGSWAQCMLSDRASESYRRGCGCHIASGAGALCREERGPFSKSTHPCKNDQSHEFANRESLADQWRQRQIMREIRCMRVGRGLRVRDEEWRRGPRRTYWKVSKGKKMEKDWASVRKRISEDKGAGEPW